MMTRPVVIPPVRASLSNHAAACGNALRSHRSSRVAGPRVSGRSAAGTVLDCALRRPARRAGRDDRRGARPPRGAHMPSRKKSTKTTPSPVTPEPAPRPTPGGGRAPEADFDDTIAKNRALPHPQSGELARGRRPASGPRNPATRNRRLRKVPSRADPAVRVTLHAVFVARPALGNIVEGRARARGSRTVIAALAPYSSPAHSRPAAQPPAAQSPGVQPLQAPPQTA